MLTYKNAILFVTPLAATVYARFILPDAWAVQAAAVVSMYLCIYGIWSLIIPVGNELRSDTSRVMKHTAYPVFLLATIFLLNALVRTSIERHRTILACASGLLVFIFSAAASYVYENSAQENGASWVRSSRRVFQAGSKIRQGEMGALHVASTEECSDWCEPAYGKITRNSVPSVSTEFFLVKGSPLDPHLHVISRINSAMNGSAMTNEKNVRKPVKQTGNSKETDEEKMERIRAEYFKRSQT